TAFPCDRRARGNPMRRPAAAQPAGPRDSETRIIRDPAGLGHLAGSWAELSARSGNPMLDLAWIASCAETFTAGRTLHIVVQGPPQQIQAVAPLVCRQDGLARLELLG